MEVLYPTRQKWLRGSFFLLTVLSVGGIGRAVHAEKAAPLQTQQEEAPEEKNDTTIANQLEFAVGENRTVSAIDVKNYSEGSPGIVDVKLTSDKTKFVLVGLKPGTSSLLLIKRDGQIVNWKINIFAYPPQIIEQELRQLIRDIARVRLRRMGSRFFLEGSVANEQELTRIKRIVSLYPWQVESLVEVGSDTTDRQTNIRIDFFFIQYNRSSGYIFGINWPKYIGTSDTFTANASYDFLKNSISAKTTIVNQPLPSLDIAANYGWVKVVKQATVITTSGTEAKFYNGGEQNFPTTTATSNSIQKISFGTSLTVLPRFYPVTRDLEINMNAEVSDLTPSIAGTVLPGRQLSNLSTLVKIRLGQSLLLTAINTQSQRHTNKGLPLFSQIPILGPLFSSQNNMDEELEGAVFIVPSVVDSPLRNTIDIVQKALEEYEDYSGRIKGMEIYNRQPWSGPSS
ncbi:pilus assembly protein N-terminal domain-containing protein [Pajaroellobacter abortibovis]|uniref:Uncharacterized protein n=1 Tax=Pajaroellobacter abortibovis TaxID=1882918 RepID=A0A1L6MYN6_9BACT|nr:pilus assembly protein N-terminal domain-containing protein [Pajaroellobacter abortibovis]APS00528.1 hypothetical protein BCY86_07450 [Pajaroellobacter abortibovis]